MPSRLVGLVKALAWTDFQGNPDPQKPNLQAFTHASFNMPVWSPVPIPGTRTGHFEDNLVITISMDPQRSWKRNPPNDLLRHEQGHYDITALIARDLFIDLMALKANTYPTAAAGLADLRVVLDRYNNKTSRINTIYDSMQQTNHGNIPTAQTRWNGMIQRAFSEPRVPQMTAPDGAVYKVQFLDVLGQNGINP
ncbi:MAG TPA: hypothetical protein VML19_23845 [Verrucomicrobiae bacterium]|nr:hypothetical protein [Verrucomicrobiae bacterium]